MPTTLCSQIWKKLTVSERFNVLFVVIGIQKHPAFNVKRICDLTHIDEYCSLPDEVRARILMSLGQDGFSQNQYLRSEELFVEYQNAL